MSDRADDDIFQLNGRLRSDVTDDATARALRDSLGHARSTNWDSVRTPHLFMGLLGTSDAAVYQWASRLGADTARLLDQFRDRRQHLALSPRRRLLDAQHAHPRRDLDAKPRRRFARDRLAPRRHDLRQRREARAVEPQVRRDHRRQGNLDRLQPRIRLAHHRRGLTGNRNARRVTSPGT